MKKTLHMIGNAHIDPVWLWRWQDGFSEVRATFRSALDRMKEYPGFIFTCAAGAYYEWVERCDPAMFEEIRSRVAEGRWRIVGGWWIQPDCNIPCGESFARQALYGQRYFQEKFGVTARTGYNVDSFGHNGMLPKVLRMSGMEHYVYMRPGNHEKNYPSWIFIWQSPEGQQVTACRIPFEYCTWGKELSDHISRCAQEIRDENGLMCFYGVGNHGGGPTKENLDSIIRLNGENDVELRFSDPDRFFDSIDKQGLPVVNGELLHHASGCYALNSAVKRWNRRAENRLLSAEKWCAAAAVMLGKSYPLADFAKAWKKVLFSQFHDILAGCCIREAYEDVREDFGYALSVAGEYLGEARQSVMRALNLPFEEGAYHYIVFNDQGFDARGQVSVEIQKYAGPMALWSAEGKRVDYQLSPGSAAANGRCRLTFFAEAPALGWQAYVMRPLPADKAAEAAAPNDGLILENETLLAEFTREKGLWRLFFKPTGTELLQESLRMDIIRDESDSWSHGVLRFDEIEGCLPVTDVRVIESGPVCRTIRVSYGDSDSTLIQDYTLFRDGKQIEIRNRLNWQKKQKVLKMHMPMTLRYCRVCAQAPFGYADRALDGLEYPMQEYVDMSGIAQGQKSPLTGLAVLNDGKYAYSAQHNCLDITLTRSPYYANHEPFVVAPDMDYPVVDRGEQEFALALLPHEGQLPFCDAERAAMLFNAPLEALTESAHDGSLPPKGSLMRLEAGHAVIDALKWAEDGEGLILHLHETAREEETATLQLLFAGKELPVHFEPGEIKALRISLAGDAEETNLIEMK